MLKRFKLDRVTGEMRPSVTGDYTHIDMAARAVRAAFLAGYDQAATDYEWELPVKKENDAADYTTGATGYYLGGTP